MSAAQTGLSRAGRHLIESTFQRQILTGLHPAAALAVYLDGRLVVDLTGGESGADSLFVVFSCGKPLAAATLWLLRDRGKLDWDEPVATYWPEFARHGKGAITVRHVLTHRAGIPTTPPQVTRQMYGRWREMIGALEDLMLEHEPGNGIQYHELNFGWLVGEIAARISGLPFERLFAEEIAAPLGLADTFFGLPPEHEGRVARLVAMPGFERPELAPIHNTAAAHRAVVPASLCISTARDLARFYAMLAAGGELDGVRLLSPETVGEVTSLQAEGEEVDTGTWRRWGLGVSLARQGQTAMGVDAGPRAFGHGGIGTSTAWADPDLRVSAAYITTGMQPSEVNGERLCTMSQAVREAARL